MMKKENVDILNNYGIVYSVVDLKKEEIKLGEVITSEYEDNGQIKQIKIRPTEVHKMDNYDFVKNVIEMKKEFMSKTAQLFNNYSKDQFNATLDNYSFHFVVYEKVE